MHQGGPAALTRWLRERGLTITLLILFLVFFAGMAVTGWQVAGQDAPDHGSAPPTLAQYLVSGDFAEATFENWESEFLAIGAMVWLSVYLRYRGSPESKPVHAAHDETGR